MLRCLRLALFLIAFASPALAQGSVGIVEKKVFALPSYTTVGGQSIEDVKVVWERYGTLNAAGDNAIIIPPFFTATSHAVVKYKNSDAATGYWEAIIGPSKAI